MTEMMTATKALVELKMLDKRINQKIAESAFVAVVRGQDKKTTQQVGLDKADKDIKAAKQSIVDMIARRNAIKTALVVANAKSTVTVNGKTSTVAEAIERKNSISYEEAFLTQLKNQYAACLLHIENHNANVEKKLQSILKAVADSEPEKASFETTVKTLRSVEEETLFDPIGITNVITKLQDDIDKFKAEVDTALSVINAQTIIEID